MKFSIKNKLFSIFSFFSVLSFGQANNYYLDRVGKLLDESQYKDLKEQALNFPGQHKGEELELVEELILIYENIDSLVYSFNLIVTDNVETTNNELKNRNSLVRKMYPLKNAESLEGKVISLNYLKGKPTLINLWFTSCVPCVAEMPALNKLRKENLDRFNFLSITMNSKSKVTNFLKKHQYDFLHIVNSKELTTDMGFAYYPVNIFLDKEGKVISFEHSVPYTTSANGEGFYDTGKFLWILESLLR
jgi:thiol-disulfide isomerase/thioredoxin